MKADEILQALDICAKGCTGDGCAYNDIAAAYCENNMCVRCVDRLAADAMELIKEQQKTIDEMTKPHGVYECFHCGARAVVLDCDYDGEDYGMSEGIVHACHCANCDAEITYFISTDGGQDDDRGEGL